MKNSFLKIIAILIVTLSVIEAEIQIKVENNHLKFVPVNNTTVDGEDVISLLRFQHLLRQNVDLNVKVDNYSNRIILPTCQELKEANMSDYYVTFHIYIDEDVERDIIIHNRGEDSISNPLSLVLKRGYYLFSFQPNICNWVAGISD
jgi:hypothetical protein